MYGTIVSAALMGLSALASARPMMATGTGSSMPMSTGSAGGFNASDFKFPLGNGFPNIKNPSSQLNKIEQQAHGTLPNGTAPPPPKSNSLTSLGFIAFNELFEVAFFTELISNITHNVAGYDQISNREEVLATLKVVLAQEELHELNANGAFNKFTGKTIEPCQYKFPVDNFYDAIALASKFTDVVLSTLPDIQTVFADDGDNELIRGVGSVIGQEGEQNGFYREILGKTPSALPFLTAGARDFAFNAILQNFVVPNTCPSLDLLEPPLKEFGILNVLSTDLSSAEDSQAKFSFQTINPGHTHSFVKQTGMYLTYINQQNTPVSVPLEDEKFTGNAVEFTALFPGKTHDFNGLTIAVITQGNVFTDVDDVADKTIFGPGLIEIN